MSGRAGTGGKRGGTAGPSGLVLAPRTSDEPGGPDAVSTGRSEAVVPRARGTHPRVVARGRRVRSLPRCARRGAPVAVLRGAADRQREARDPSRRTPHLQGRVPALQDDDGSPGPPEGRLGLPRAAG